MFSVLLKELRSQKGCSQKKLAQEVGVSPGNISDWESDRNKPGYNALISLARFFGVSADYLLELDCPSKPDNPGLMLDDYKAEQGLVCDGSPLTEAETDLVAMFRLLPPSHQEELFDLTYFKYRRHVEEKRESIYSTYIDTGANRESGHTPDNHRAATA